LPRANSWSPRVEQLINTCLQLRGQAEIGLIFG
jgi:hypothetical protein